MRRLFLALPLLIAAGCGGGPDRLDASTSEAAKSSKAKIMEKLPEDQKKQFQADLQTMMAVKVADHHGRRKPGPPDESEFLKDIDGLTAAQIHEKAEAARADQKSRQGAAVKK